VKDPSAPDTLYVTAFAAPDTVDTMPDKTIKAFADHGTLNGAMARDGGAADATIASIEKAGIDVGALAAQLQKEGADAFVKSWKQLLQRIAEKSR
jgi:transaldolase